MTRVKKALANPIVLGAIVLVAWSIPWMIGGCSVVVDGHRYFFLADDPTISLRYGRNFANGLGLVWNAGEHVEGYSNLLWTLYMALLHKLPISDANMGLAIMVTNIGIAIAGMVFAYRIAQKLAPGWAAAFLVVAAYALNGDLFEWMIRGFETSLMATLLLAAFLRLIGDVEHGKPRLATYLLIGLLTLVRTDGMILAGPLFLFGLLTATGQRPRAFVYSAIAVAIPAAHLWFRWSYYGDYLPNTAYLKLFGYAGRLMSGFRWTLKFYLSYPIAALFVGIALVRIRDWPFRAGAALWFLFTLYTVYIGGDSFDGFRFLAPLIPLFLLLAFGSAWRLIGPEVETRVAAIADRLVVGAWVEPALVVVGVVGFVAAAILWPDRGQQRIVRQSAISFAGAVALGVAVFAAARMAKKGGLFAKLPRLGTAAPARLAIVVMLLADMPALMWTHRHPAPWGPAYPDNVRMGLYLKDHTPANAKIGDSWAGIVAYFSDRQGIDFLGKCDPHIAHMPAASEGTVPGHNKFDYDWSIGHLHPDFVIASFKLPVTEAEMAEDARGDYAFIGRLYFNDVFRQRCMPHPVDAPPELRRTIFACDWR